MLHAPSADLFFLRYLVVLPVALFSITASVSFNDTTRLPNRHQTKPWWSSRAILLNQAAGLAGMGGKPKMSAELQPSRSASKPNLPRNRLASAVANSQRKVGTC